MKELKDYINEGMSTNNANITEMMHATQNNESDAIVYWGDEYVSCIINLSAIDPKTFFGNDKFTDCYDEITMSFKKSLKEQMSDDPEADTILIEMGADMMTLFMVSDRVTCDGEIAAWDHYQGYKDITWKELKEKTELKQYSKYCCK